MMPLSISAFAQDYDPNSVILLKKDRQSPVTLQDRIDSTRGGEGRSRIQDRANRRRQDLPATVSVIPQNQPVIVTPVPQTPTQQQTGGKKETDKATQELSTAYAAHLYTSVCSEEYRDSLAPRTEKNLDTQRMWTDIQTSCRCMSDQILTMASSADMADFVMYNYGWGGIEKPDPESDSYFQSDKNAAISDMAANAGFRKKCGFLN